MGQGTIVHGHYDIDIVLNEQVTSAKTSRQTFAILGKIREADHLQLREPDQRLRDKARAIVREIHPELCFWGLNHRRPMQNNKKKLAGRNERLELIEKL